MGPPGMDPSLQIMVRSLTPLLDRASMNLWALPHPMKPPNITVAPSGISLTASSMDTNLGISFDLLKVY